MAEYKKKRRLSANERFKRSYSGAIAVWLMLAVALHFLLLNNGWTF